MFYSVPTTKTLLHAARDGTLELSTAQSTSSQPRHQITCKTPYGSLQREACKSACKRLDMEPLQHAMAECSLIHQALAVSQLTRAKDLS